MATVVNNPQAAEGSNGMSFLLGVILIIVFLALFFFYGLPYLSNSVQGPQVSVPEKIDVNVNQGK